MSQCRLKSDFFHINYILNAYAQNFLLIKFFVKYFYKKLCFQLQQNEYTWLQREKRNVQVHCNIFVNSHLGRVVQSLVKLTQG